MGCSLRRSCPEGKWNEPNVAWGDQHESGYLQRAGAADGVLPHSLWCPVCQHGRLSAASHHLRVWELVCSLRGHEDLWGRSVTLFRFHWPCSGH